MSEAENFTATVEDVVPVLPAGIYVATFTSIEKQSNDTGDYWLWKFTVYNDGQNIEITATSSPRITPRTKAAKFLAGLGLVPKIGEQVDFSLLKNTVCQLVVTINESGYSRIESVLPYVEKPSKK